MTYSVVWKKCKNLILRIKNTGEIAVTAPLNTSEKRIAEFLAEKSAWIDSNRARIFERNQKFSKFSQYRCFLFCGKVLEPKIHKEKGIYVSDKFLMLPEKSFPSIGAALNEKQLRLLRRWYIDAAKNIIFPRLKELSTATCLDYAQEKISNAKSKWGSCNREKLIMLNWRIVMLPPFLADYIMIHELAHTLELNHSKKFWHIVDSLFKDFKKARKQLKDFSFVVELFK